MPEIIPINSNVHFKAAFDVKGEFVPKPMTHLRQKFRAWCIDKVGDNDPTLHRSWFYIGNNPKVEPAQYHINDHQLRTVSAPSDDPDEPNCWAFEMIHTDSDESARRWSVEITLRKIDDGSVRFTTVVRNWMMANYIGEYPAPPSPSAPSYVRSIIDDPALFCSKGDAQLHSKPIIVTNSLAQTVYDALVSTDRQVPFVFIAHDNQRNGVLIPPHRVAKSLIGNANVYVLSTSSVVDEMNYYLGEELSCSPGSVRVYLPRLDKEDANNSRRHRYLSAIFIMDHGEDKIVQFLTNGLSRNGATFRMGDLTSFSDIFSERRKHAIKKLADQSAIKSEEAASVRQDYVNLTTELSNWESTAIQFESENIELQKDLANLKYRVEEAERVRHQIRDLKSQLKGIEALATMPQSLSDVLWTVATLFPNRIEISDNAYATAESYAEKEAGFWGRPEGLAIAWEMVFGFATRLYELIFELESNRLEEEFGLSFSTFELALTEGKQTQKDAKLMALRKLQHDGQEFDMTPHVKFGNRPPKMLRLYYAVNREGKKLIVGHFGDHLDNYTTKTM
jgi:hypothetical protein